jgi:hypothetical protein
VDDQERARLAFGDPGLSELARVPASAWPSVAAGWLTRGFESVQLIEFAALSPAQGAEVGELVMPELLQSIGLPIKLTEPFSIAEVSGFADRCRAALSPVQLDLNRTGYGRFVLELDDTSAGRELPQLIPSIAGFGHGGDPGMTPDIDDDGDLAAAAAESVSETLLEFFGSWPRCSKHHGPRRLRPYPPDVTLNRPEPTTVAWWWCWADQPHPVQPLGELADAYGTTRHNH